MGLTIMILGLAIFLGVHLFTIMRGQRAALVARLGDNGYKGLYSLLSLIGLVLIVYGFARYRQGEWIDIWFPPVWTKHLAALLVLFAFIMLVASYSRGHIYTTLKHPMLAAVKLWALAHLMANGDLGSIILFGSILAWAVIDRISLKRRSDPGAPPIPVGGMRNDVIAIFGGVVLYAVFGLWFHPYVIGIPVFGA
jgi:uncharacterized membrane protein